MENNNTIENKPLIIAGLLSYIGAVLHLATIIGGPNWYRFFGAGEEMAQLAEQGSIIPTLLTLVITVVLCVWGLYAFSGAGLIRRLPFLKLCLSAITSVYLIRGVGGTIIAFMPNSLQVQELGFGFMLWSSLICAVFGIFHLVGTYKSWPYIAQKSA